MKTTRKQNLLAAALASVLDVSAVSGATRPIV